MGASDEVWARHSWLWSVGSRLLILPLFALAIWSSVWIGWWGLPAVGPVMFPAGWNPRAFPLSASTNRWSAKGTFRDRVFLNRNDVLIPAPHERWATWPGFVGMPLFARGLGAFELWPTLLGLILIVLPKRWKADRMVWLCEAMKEEVPAYRAWLRQTLVVSDSTRRCTRSNLRTKKEHASLPGP